MTIDLIPSWMQELDEEDLTFMKRFLLASGSLKEIAQHYQVSYPTVRLRLDRLIQKIRMAEETGKDPYIRLIKRLAIDEKIEVDVAKLLVSEYKKKKE